MKKLKQDTSFSNLQSMKIVKKKTEEGKKRRCFYWNHSKWTKVQVTCFPKSSKSLKKLLPFSHCTLYNGSGNKNIIAIVQSLNCLGDVHLILKHQN